MRAHASRLIAASSAVAVALVLASAPAAWAASPTSIEFIGETTVDADFGADWMLQLAVSTQFEDSPQLRLGPTDGTVDVYVSGIGGVFAGELPIQPDGTVYVSQPAAMPLLPAGEYSVTAIYNPSAGGYFVSSQTLTPAKLTIKAQTVSSTVEVSTDATVSRYPVITATLGGSYVEGTGGAPSGTWAFSVASAGHDPVFTADVAQKNGSTEPVRVEIDSKLESGTEYTVTTKFTPVDELAGGIVVAESPTTVFSTPGTTFIDSLGTRLPFPWWVVVVISVLFAGLVATVITLAVKLRRRGPVASVQRIPGEPENVEEMSWEEAGIGRVRADTEPSTTTWLLSDVEPSIGEAGIVEPSDAPTERLDWQKPTEGPTAQ